MELCGGDGSPWSSPPSPGPVEEEQCLFAISLFTLTFASQSIKQGSFTSCLGGPRSLIYPMLTSTLLCSWGWLTSNPPGLITSGLSMLDIHHYPRNYGPRPLSFPRSFLSETGTHTAKSGLRFAVFENSELFSLFLARISSLHRHTQLYVVQGTEPRA